MKNSVLKSLLFFAAVLVGVSGFAQSQKVADNNLINEYVAKNHLNGKKTSSGLYYVITKKGTGEKAKFGKKVSMNYLGKFLDGKKFDANVDDNFNATHPFAFTLGTGQVIRGWDEGVQLLNVGDRATLILPSDIAYGARGVGPIPPNTVLVFDVELVSQDK
jgi:FKBP-type peptidyl-prolyl cis-trans isomerase FkpA